MDYTKNGTGKALIPFMDNKYKVDLFQNGGVIEDLEGNKIKLYNINLFIYTDTVSETDAYRVPLGIL